MNRFSLKNNAWAVLKVHCQSNSKISANSTFKNITSKSKTSSNTGRSRTSLAVSITKDSVFSLFPSGRPQIIIDLHLEYCSILSAIYSNFSALVDKETTLLSSSTILAFLSNLSFSFSSSFEDVNSIESAKSSSYFSSFICV